MNLSISVRLAVKDHTVTADGLPEPTFWNDVHLAMECTTQAFLQMLAHLFDSISPYNYEVLAIVQDKWIETLEKAIKEANEIDEEEELEELEASLKFVVRSRLVVRFLKSHARVKSPDKDEVDWWMQSFPGDLFPSQEVGSPARNIGK